MNDSRDQALRRMLVERASAAPRPRPVWRVVALAAGAFALGGVLAVGTLVAFTGLPRGGFVGADDPLTVEFPNAEGVMDDDVRILGAPLFSTGERTITIDLGTAPAGANGIAIAAACVDVAEYRLLLDGRYEMGMGCTEEPDRPMSGGGGGVIPFRDGPPRALTVEVAYGTYVISALWVYQPPDAEPSAEQSAALADGVVSREEYEAGFDAYVACMADLGFEVSLVGMRDAEIIGYVIPGDAGMSGPANRCYEEHFSLVDMEWQVAHQD